MFEVILTATFSVLLSMCVQQAGEILVKYDVERDQDNYEEWLEAEQEKLTNVNH